MRVYLALSTDQRPHVARHVPDDAEAGDSDSPRGGLRGWLARKSAHFKTSWRTSEGLLVRKLRGTWDWLQRRAHPDESMLSGLRSTPVVEVVHADSVSPEEARRLWHLYLGRRQRRHAVWLTANLLVAPFTVLLVPAPGPNLVGYWFAYRAIHHGLILAGLRRVKRGRVPTHFVPGDESPEASEGPPDGVP